MITKYEVGFDTKLIGLYFGKFHHCYEIEEDAYKIYLCVRIYKRMFLIFKTYNKYIEKLWYYLVVKIKLKR